MSQNDSSKCPYYWFEVAYVEYLRSNHLELLNSVCTKGVKSVPGLVNGDLRLEIYELKLQMCEVKSQLAQMMVKMMEGKEGIKEEINEAKKGIKEEIKEEIKGNKSPPVFTCQIS